VFEPRSNTSRRRVFQDEFIAALASADEAVLSTPFTKENDPLPPDERLDSAAVVAGVADRGVPARLLGAPPEIRDYLVASAKAGDVIVIMSNGAFGGLPRLVAESLSRA
jgi:UDP-N-acetylmuramate: L-alanyl-gamma-D-glutamyl-meso-diaminopimelate ligase